MLSGHESDGPEICACCARPAIPVCVHGRSALAFTCAFCGHELLFSVVAMNLDRLHALEQKAVASALVECPVDLVGAMLRALIDHGVNDLGALNAGNYDAAKTAVTSAPGFQSGVEAVLLTYTKTIRREITKVVGSEGR